MIEIIICDDDDYDLNHTIDILHKILYDMKIEYHITSFLSSNDILNKIQKIDIGVLDIAMKDCNGIELGRKLKEKFPYIKLIYMTNFEEYCIQVINQIHAFSFLCKPLDKYKVQEQIKDAIDSIPKNFIEKEFYKVTDSKNRKYNSIKLYLKDILYLEYIKGQRKALIVLADEVYKCKCIFGNLEKELEPYGFAVNCRGSLVNLSHVQKIKGFILYLDNNRELSIAQKRIVDFKVKMNEFLQEHSFRRE